jgi:alginate O-acetyltransferase complex protein AlgI
LIFTSSAYVVFFLLVALGYWAVAARAVPLADSRKRALQNGLLLGASYVFYGWITPWFCLLLAFSTVLDFSCGLGMGRYPSQKRRFLIASLVGNLGMLGVFKYFGFFVDSVGAALATVSLDLPLPVLQIALPVGISFYTFQTLSYTIDIYRGTLEPRRNFVDFALFVAFFPQLVAGPIERASRMLPQIERTRRWSWDDVVEALRLLTRGYVKKLVIADNVGGFVSRVYALEQPSLLLLAVATGGFAVQIYADFSAYTDIARGCARALGFDLMRNFRSPYLAISPSDFWRRWHISLSTWIRDYLYISLGGSRTGSQARLLGVLILTLGLSGLWHGAAWNFVAWGLFHGILLSAYRTAGLGGRWRPQTAPGTAAAWAVMQCLTLIGWALFRSTDIQWLGRVVSSAPLGVDVESLLTSLFVFGGIAPYALIFMALGAYDRLRDPPWWLDATVQAFGVALLLGLSAPEIAPFIYFQF